MNDEVVLDVIADARPGAEQPFAAADLGERRRTRRPGEAAAKGAAPPEKSFPRVFDRIGLRGPYRSGDRPRATAEAPPRPHAEPTRQAMGRPAPVLLPHDATRPDFPGRRKSTGAGRIGNGNGRGFLQHNSPAVPPRPRQAPGLAYQQS